MISVKMDVLPPSGFCKRFNVSQVASKDSLFMIEEFVLLGSNSISSQMSYYYFFSYLLLLNSLKVLNMKTNARVKEIRKKTLIISSPILEILLSNGYITV